MFTSKGSFISLMTVAYAWISLGMTVYGEISWLK